MVTKEALEQLGHEDHFNTAIGALVYAAQMKDKIALLDAQVHATLAVYKFLLEERDEEIEHARKQFELMTKVR